MLFYDTDDLNDQEIYLQLKKAIEGALKLLKPNGIIVASFISNYAPIQDYLKNLYPIDSIDELLVFMRMERVKRRKDLQQHILQVQNKQRN